MIYTIKYKAKNSLQVEKRYFKKKANIEEYIKSKNGILISSKLELYDTFFKKRNVISNEEILQLLLLLQSIDKYTKSEAKTQQILENFGSNDKRYKNLKDILNKLAYALTQGITVSRALEQLGVEKFIVKAIETGQETGSLENVYNLLIDLYKMKISTESQTRKALFMPKLIMALITLFFIGAILFFIPQVKQMASVMNFENLPAISQWFFNLNTYSETHKYTFIFLTFLTVYGIYKSIMYLFVKFARYLPKIKDVFLAENFTIIAAILSIALTSRMQYYEAFMFASETAKDKKLKNDLIIVSNMMEQRGLSILKTLEELKYNEGNNYEKDFYNIVFMLDGSGEIEKGFLNIYKDYKEKLIINMESAVALINPLAMVIVGIVVAVVIMGAYAPLYSVGK